MPTLSLAFRVLVRCSERGLPAPNRSSPYRKPHLTLPRQDRTRDPFTAQSNLFRPHQKHPGSGQSATPDARPHPRAVSGAGCFWWRRRVPPPGPETLLRTGHQPRSDRIRLWPVRPSHVHRQCGPTVLALCRANAHMTFIPPRNPVLWATTRRPKWLANSRPAKHRPSRPRISTRASSACSPTSRTRARPRQHARTSRLRSRPRGSKAILDRVGTVSMHVHVPHAARAAPPFG
jgi:hypothetical protein